MPPQGTFTGCRALVLMKKISHGRRIGLPRTLDADESPRPLPLLAATYTRKHNIDAAAGERTDAYSVCSAFDEPSDFMLQRQSPAPEARISRSCDKSAEGRQRVSAASDRNRLLDVAGITRAPRPGVPAGEGVVIHIKKVGPCDISGAHAAQKQHIAARPFVADWRTHWNVI